MVPPKRPSPAAFAVTLAITASIPDAVIQHLAIVLGRILAAMW